MRPPRYSVYWLPNVILHVSYGRVLGVVWQIKLDREQNDSLSFINFEDRSEKFVIRLEVRSFLAAAIF